MRRFLLGIAVLLAGIPALGRNYVHDVDISLQLQKDSVTYCF